MGTGLKECILSGLLSVKGKKVLHVDRNPYYGGDCASLNLSVSKSALQTFLFLRNELNCTAAVRKAVNPAQEPRRICDLLASTLRARSFSSCLQNLYRKFVKDEEPPKEFFDLLGSNRDYNVDLIPKFIMANGNLVKLLVATDVTRYLDFKLIDGCYVFKRGAGIFKVPATMEEARSTSLLSLMQKNWLRSLLQAIDAYRLEDPKTWKGSMDWSKSSCADLFKYMWFDKDTGDFVGHAMALEESDDYLAKPAYPTMMAVKLYGESLARYGE